jgi:hypothetical protein
MNRILTTAFLLLCFSTTYSQKIATTFYDSAWRLTTKSFAQYYRTGTIDTKKYQYHGEVKDYYMNGTLQMKGRFQANIKTDTFYFYYPSGRLMSKEVYDNNRRFGFWTNYYENGKVKEVLGFDGDFVCALEYYDEDGTPQLVNGTGDWRTEFYDDLIMDIVQIEGSYQDTLRHGIWKSYRKSIIPGLPHEKRLECVEEYDHGIFIKGKYYWGGGGIEDLGRPTMRILPERDKFSKMDSWASSKYASIEEYPMLKFLPKIDSTVFPVDEFAQFPGGLDSLRNAVARNMKLSKSYISSQNERSSSITIMIDKDGVLKIKEPPYTAPYPGDQLFNDQSLKAIKKLPHWRPAKRGKKAVVNYFSVSVLMENGNIDVSLTSMNEKRPFTIQH